MTQSATIPEQKSSQDTRGKTRKGAGRHPGHRVASQGPARRGLSARRGAPSLPGPLSRGAVSCCHACAAENQRPFPVQPCARSQHLLLSQFGAGPTRSLGLILQQPGRPRAPGPGTLLLGSRKAGSGTPSSLVRGAQSSSSLPFASGGGVIHPGLLEAPRKWLDAQMAQASAGSARTRVGAPRAEGARSQRRPQCLPAAPCMD